MPIPQAYPSALGRLPKDQRALPGGLEAGAAEDGAVGAPGVASLALQVEGGRESQNEPSKHWKLKEL
ncbi:MAG: hypothetical protein ACRD1J_01840 [Terriglobia bacterium]